MLTWGANPNVIFINLIIVLKSLARSLVLKRSATWRGNGGGCAKNRPMRKGGAGGVVLKRNRLLDNELTRQTPCAKHS
jgi:hypothetical protein